MITRGVVKQHGDKPYFNDETVFPDFTKMTGRCYHDDRTRNTRRKNQGVQRAGVR